MNFPERSTKRSSYWRVWLTFARNSLVREMSFRANFLITLATRLLWFCSMMIFFKVVFLKTRQISGWSEYEYFAFMATGMIINSLIETFFMANCTNFSEQIRTGNLDFALLKPIDTQFLISLEKMEWSVLSNLLFAGGLLFFSLHKLGVSFSITEMLVYLGFIGVGVSVFYSIMLVLTSASVWMGRNRGLHEFWFYVTVFSRYPRNIYQGSLGLPIYYLLSYCIPILLVVSIPAESLANRKLYDPRLAIVFICTSLMCLAISRWIFNYALKSYRSASS